MAKFTGGCVCGAIRYECDAEPIMMFKCHCRDCQHVSGGGYAPVLLFSRKICTSRRVRPALRDREHGRRAARARLLRALRFAPFGR